MARGKVLYVEDSKFVGQFVRDALLFEGIDAIVAEHATRALEVLADRAHQIDLVLCDHALPDMTGLELMKTIRQRYPDLRLVLTTGFAGNDVEAMAAQYDGLLLKPFEPSEVVALLP